MDNLQDQLLAEWQLKIFEWGSKLDYYKAKQIQNVRK